MLVELGVKFGTGAESTLLVGLTVDDVERLRAGEELSFRLRDAGLVFLDELDGREPRTLVIAFGRDGDPKQHNRLRLTEAMIDWMRDTTPLSHKLEDLGAPEGTLVLFHGKTDEDTAAAVRRSKERLARTLIPDTSVLTTIAVDRKSGHVSVSRSEGSPGGARHIVTRTAAASEARPSWAPVLGCAIGSIASFAGAFGQHDALGRGVAIACGLVFAGVGAWCLRKVLRHAAR